MKDRLLKFLSREQLTSKQFAALIGVQPSSVSHILSGRNKPSFDFMEKIALNYPSVNLEWLITGKGSMFSETESTVDTGQRDLFTPREETATVEKEKEKQEVTNVNNDLLKGDYNSNMKEKDRAEGSDLKLSGKGKKVEMIVVMYSDRTFSEYFPVS